MPHLWNDIFVVTSDELLPWYNLKQLQQEIHRHKGKEYGIKKVCSGGNGRQLLVAYDSLSSEIKNTLGDPRKPAHLMELFYKTEPEAVRFYQKFCFDDESALGIAHQEEYITNASVLAACVRLKEARERERRSKGGSMVGVLKTVCEDAHSFNATLEQKYKVRHTLPESEKRFKEAFKGFLKGYTDGRGEKWLYDYNSLISGKLRNQNSRKVYDPVLRLLNDMFAGQGHKPSRTEISRTYDGFIGGYVEVINPETGEMYDPKDFKQLSDATIINYLGNWNERIGTYAKRSGDRQKLMGAFKPYHSLDKPKFAGSIISVDDRQPPFEYAKGERVWFYNAIDLGSEAFTCWVYGKSKEGIIMDFYRQLVRNYAEWGFNLPAEIEAEMSLNSSFTDTFLKPGAMFDSVRIEANNARGKRIERYFGDLRYGSEKERTGWLARPFAARESNQAGPGKKVIVPYGEIIENCLRDIEDWNNKEHRDHPGKTRWEVFCEMQHPDLKPTNYKAILPHVGYGTETSVNAGIVKLQEKEFLLGNDDTIYTGDRLINLMKRIEGNKVMAYWLDDNMGGVLKAVLYVDDICICQAVPKPRYNRAKIERTEKDELAYQTMSAYVATIDGYMREKRSQINDVIVIDNRPKTLNRKFLMPGLERREQRETGDLMPEIVEDEAIIPEINKSYHRSLKDRI